MSSDTTPQRLCPTYLNQQLPGRTTGRLHTGIIISKDFVERNLDCFGYFPGLHGIVPTTMAATLTNTVRSPTT